MRAAAVIDQAFIDIALLQGFVAPVPAVLLLVTHFADVYAFATSALELSRAQALIDVFAIDFVRAIYTVPDAIALPAAMDAATIFTFKLVRSAGSRRAVDLVTAVLAVGISVTPPFFVNAFARAALDLAGRTFRVHRGLTAALFERLV